MVARDNSTKSELPKMKDDLNRQRQPAHSKLATRVVAAYVSRNYLAPDQLPQLIVAIHNQFCDLQQPATDRVTRDDDVILPSAVQIRRSVSDEALISFIDGHPYKTLKRHLTAHGLTPQQYRERYGLPADYPMVAPAYAKRRSALAKAIGLGVPGGQAKRQPAA